MGLAQQQPQTDVVHVAGSFRAYEPKGGDERVPDHCENLTAFGVSMVDRPSGRQAQVDRYRGKLFRQAAAIIVAVDPGEGE